MKGFVFGKFNQPEDNRSQFEKMLDVFLQLLSITGGDVNEALDWMNELDRQYGMTSNEYGMGDFIEDLKKEGYIKEEEQSGIQMPTAKAGQIIRQSALEEIFGKLRKGNPGKHKTKHSGAGEDASSDLREYEFGDLPEQISMTESIRNAQVNNGVGDFMLTERDLTVREKEFSTNTSTILMIDISHSMILYGEDRITPAKKTAMALSELILRKYHKDTLDIIVFGNDAWQIELKDLPYLKVGPYHTNTVAGLELAMNLLRKRKNRNKQIFMITDGKPSCLKEHGRYYKNSFGLDEKIVRRCLNLADAARRLKIPITTFMIATDPYLQRFVRDFTETNQGKAYYSGLDNLGEFVFEDFERNRRKSLRG